MEPKPAHDRQFDPAIQPRSAAQPAFAEPRGDARRPRPGWRSAIRLCGAGLMVAGVAVSVGCAVAAGGRERFQPNARDTARATRAVLAPHDFPDGSGWVR